MSPFHGMRAILFILSFLLTFSAFGMITSITPAVGTVSGGDLITITVDRTLHTCILCSPGFFYAEVTFGGVPARSVDAWEKTIRVMTPEHAAGNVEVAVKSEGEPYGTATFAFGGIGGPFNRAAYEKVLVPVSVPRGRTVPGAFGSHWASELWVSNRSEFPVELFNDITCTVICAAQSELGSPYPRIAANSVVRLDPLDAGGNVGYLYYVQKTGASQVSFSLHVADLSRSHENAGTEVGVVRESELRYKTFDILNVPIDESSRASLRIYDTDAHPGTHSALVRIFSMDGTFLALTRIPMSLPVAKPDHPLASLVPAFAGFGQIGDLRNAQYETQPASWPSRVRIIITMSDGVTGYAIASVTNNATQLITTYRPE